MNESFDEDVTSVRTPAEIHAEQVVQEKKRAREERLRKKAAEQAAARASIIDALPSVAPKPVERVLSDNGSEGRDMRTEVRSWSELREVVIRAGSFGLRVDEDVAGGYLVAGGEVFDELLRQEAKVSVMRAISRVLPPLVGAESLPIPSVEAAMANAEWTSELGVGATDATAAFGRRNLVPHPINKRVRTSARLLRIQPKSETWVLEMIAEAIATPQEVGFLQGSGTGEPLGITSDPAVPVFTTTAIGGITSADITAWLTKLPARFLRRAQVLTSVDFLRHVLNLVDGGVRPFMPYMGRLLNLPVQLTDGLPAVVDANDALVPGAVAAIVGDFSWFWIVDDADVRIQRLVELYAETGEVGFDARQETDGLAVIPTAFYVLKIRAS